MKIQLDLVTRAWQAKAKRFFRELRVDRIWEGASEVQHLIITRALARRSLEEL